MGAAAGEAGGAELPQSLKAAIAPPSTRSPAPANPSPRQRGGLGAGGVASTRTVWTSLQPGAAQCP